MSNYQGLQTQKSKLGTYWFIYDHFIGKSHFFGALCHSNLSQFSQFSCSGMSDSLWPPWTAAGQASLSITNSRSPPKPMSIVLVMPSNHLILYRPLLLLPSIFPSIRAFSNESALHIRWPKYWSFSFNNRPSNEHPGLISFRMDWLDHQIGWHEISSSLPLSRVSKGERSWLWLAAVRLPPAAWHPHPFPRHLAGECQGSPPL